MDSEREVKEGLVKLHRNRCKNIEYITITYSNERQNKADGWLVSSCTDVPTKNSKIVGDLIGDWGRLADGTAKSINAGLSI